MEQVIHLFALIGVCAVLFGLWSVLRARQDIAEDQREQEQILAVNEQLRLIAEKSGQYYVVEVLHGYVVKWPGKPRKGDMPPFYHENEGAAQLQRDTLNQERMRRGGTVDAGSAPAAVQAAIGRRA